MARSLIGHLLGAVSGGALYRTRQLPASTASARSCSRTGSRSTKLPFLPRGFRSASFDAEGVATRESALVRDGVLQRYVLGSYSARKLGLQTTAQRRRRAQPAGRGQRRRLRRACCAAWARGLLVTELMGQGVNTVTGDYSRGAAGFWIENGEIAFPVDGITIAGNLQDDVPGDRGGRQRRRSALAHPHRFDPGRADDGGGRELERYWRRSAQAALTVIREPERLSRHEGAAGMRSEQDSVTPRRLQRRNDQ